MGVIVTTPEDSVFAAAEAAVRIGAVDNRFAQLTEAAVTLVGAGLAAQVAPNERASLCVPVQVMVDAKASPGALLLLDHRVVVGWSVGVLKPETHTVSAALADVTDVHAFQRKVGKISDLNDALTFSIPDGSVEVVFYSPTSKPVLAATVEGVLGGWATVSDEGLPDPVEATVPAPSPPAFDPPDAGAAQPSGATSSSPTPRTGKVLAALAAAILLVAVVIGLVKHAQTSGSRAPSTATSTASSGFAVRPLVAHSVPVVNGARWHPLGFSVPSDEAAYAALSDAQRSSLLSLLANAHCGDPAFTTSFHVVCDSGGKTAYLAGPLIADQSEVASAQATPPDAVAGRTSWSVVLRFDSEGAAKLADYTARHSSADQSVVPDSCDVTYGSPCADVLVFSVGDREVLVASLTAAIRDGQVEISGSFDKATATSLAQQIAG